MAHPRDEERQTGGTPHSQSDDDLAERCRRLARKCGQVALEDQHMSPHDYVSPPSPDMSPSRNQLHSPLSPNSRSFSPSSPRASYPTPEGSFILLDEILEEEGEGNKERDEAPNGSPGTQAPPTTQHTALGLSIPKQPMQRE